MRVVLFDIDGTLLDSSGAGRRALEQAARDLTGRQDVFDGIAFDGMTDRAICRAGLARLEADGPGLEARIEQLLERYLLHLTAEVARAADYRVMPGVETLVNRLTQPGVAIGLGTGNVSRGARIKLGRAGLERHFPFGGFGDDAEERSAVLRAGLERAERLHGKLSEAWIIGDTPRDLAAARAVGARTVLVATGRYGVEELSALGPEVCVETLEDPRLDSLL